jgi:hypothetical protein
MLTEHRSGAIVLALVAVALFVGNALAPSKSPAQLEPPTERSFTHGGKAVAQPQQRTNQQQDTAQHAAPSVESSERTAPDNTSRAQREHMDNERQLVEFTRELAVYTSKLASFTGWLVAATVVLGAIGVWTGCLTRGALKLARAEFAATFRPRIKIFSLESSRDFDRADEITHGVERRFVNSGESDARIIEIGSKLLVKTPPLESGIKMNIEAVDIPLASGAKDKRAIFSGLFDDVKIAHRSERNGSDRLFCIGYIAYEDGRGLRRETGFCRWRHFRGDDLAWHTDHESSYEYSY